MPLPCVTGSASDAQNGLSHPATLRGPGQGHGQSLGKRGWGHWGSAGISLLPALSPQFLLCELAKPLPN